MELTINLSPTRRRVTLPALCDLSQAIGAPYKFVQRFDYVGERRPMSPLFLPAIKH